MATKTWKVNTLQRELADGYVNKAIYRVDGKDGDYEFRLTGSVDLPKPNTLIPYEDLTESTVLGWIKAKIDSDYSGGVAAIENSVENSVNALKTPTTGLGKPW